MSEDTDSSDTFTMNENLRGHASSESPRSGYTEQHWSGQSSPYGSEETTSCSQDFGQFPYMLLKQRGPIARDDVIRPAKRDHRTPALWFPVKNHDGPRERSPEARARTNVLPAIKHRRDSPAGAIIRERVVCFGKPPPGKPRTRPIDDSNKCYTCGKEFPSMAQLYWHLLMHAGERSNTCHQCGKGFASKKSRKRHMLMHAHEDEAYDGEVRRRVKREEAAADEPTTLVESQTECSIVFVEGENFEKHVYLDNPWGSEPGPEAASWEMRSEQDACSYSPESVGHTQVGETGHALPRSGEHLYKHPHTERGDDHPYGYCSPALEVEYEEPQTAYLDMSTWVESPSDELGNSAACSGDYDVQLLVSLEEDDRDQSSFHGESPNSGDIDEVAHVDLPSGAESQDDLLIGENVAEDACTGWSWQAEPPDCLAIRRDHEHALEQTQLNSPFMEHINTCPTVLWRSGEEGPDDSDSHGCSGEPRPLLFSLNTDPRDNLPPNENHHGNERDVSKSKSDVDHYSEQDRPSGSSSKTAFPQESVKGTDPDNDSHKQASFGGKVQDYRHDYGAGCGFDEHGASEMDSEEDDVKCPVCGRFFTSTARLSAHVLLHGTGKSLRCRRCPMSFASEHLRSRHMTAHMTASGLECAVCSKKYKSSDSLRRHVPRHDTHRWYECRVCHKRFPFRSHVRRHLMIHTGEKPYTCHVCRKGFANTGSLTVHVRLHIGERPYQCSLCGKSFCTSAKLARHLSSRKCE